VGLSRQQDAVFGALVFTYFIDRIAYPHEFAVAGNNFAAGRQMQKSPGETPGDFSLERPNTI
jgi:hypothetical protein